MPKDVRRDEDKSKTRASLKSVQEAVAAFLEQRYADLSTDERADLLSATMETFVAKIEREPVRDVPAFACTIARGKAANWLRRRKRERAALAAVAQGAVPQGRDLVGEHPAGPVAPPAVLVARIAVDGNGRQRYGRDLPSPPRVRARVEGWIAARRGELLDGPFADWSAELDSDTTPLKRRRELVAKINAVWAVAGDRAGDVAVRLDLMRAIDVAARPVSDFDWRTHPPGWAEPVAVARRVFAAAGHLAEAGLLPEATLAASIDSWRRGAGADRAGRGKFQLVAQLLAHLGQDVKPAALAKLWQRRASET